MTENLNDIMNRARNGASEAQKSLTLPDVIRQETLTLSDVIRQKAISQKAGQPQPFPELSEGARSLLPAGAAREYERIREHKLTMARAQTLANDPLWFKRWLDSGEEPGEVSADELPEGPVFGPDAWAQNLDQPAPTPEEAAAHQKRQAALAAHHGAVARAALDAKPHREARNIAHEAQQEAKRRREAERRKRRGW